MAPSILEPALPSSVLALATTVHLALAALRHHRRPGTRASTVLTFVSVALSFTPWVFPSGAGLALGLAVQAAWFLACERLARPAAGPVVPVAPTSATLIERRAPGDRRVRADRRTAGWVPVPILVVFKETTDIQTLRLARPDGFNFVAGQFLPVRVRIDGREHVRCYSISSSPSASGYLEISIKRQGLVSGALHAMARPGAILTVRAPAGSFHYPAGDDRPLLLVAGGIGITPMLAMLRHAVEAEPGRPVTLLYSAATEDALAFKDEIRSLVHRHPQARAFFAVTKGRGGAEFYAGRIDAGLLGATMPDVANAIAMVCGPGPMIEGMRSLLLSLGMAAPQIRSELFEAAVAASGGHHVPFTETGAPRTERPHTHGVTCARSKTALQSAMGQTLLEAAEAGGLAIDSLCRSGVCGTCRTRVIEGDIRCDSTLIDDEDRARGYVLACVSHVNSDCVIDL